MNFPSGHGTEKPTVYVKEAKVSAPFVLDAQNAVLNDNS